jgi:hypothetical protein
VSQRGSRAGRSASTSSELGEVAVMRAARAPRGVESLCMVGHNTVAADSKTE